MRAWWRRDDGSATAEITLATPLLVMLLVVVGIVIHRGVDARIRIDDAAHQAARAASLERHLAVATAAARATTRDALAAAGVACRHHEVTTSIHGLRPGGTLHVTVTCDVDIGDTLIPGLTTTQHVSATAHEPVDQWRSTRNEP
ncbi:TadE/TadG family type IV pilus assembly protein [Actinophytocola sp. NPDC049390]|uniref:TadE/TadG family type IV pilus assembly protein n=1 Tax=Actinophytocola sp. NPDC049390 TaxID=3363894 RepID=UPI0037945880